MRNQYPGTCYRCGNRVEIADGHFERIPWQQRKAGVGKWRMQHASCAIKYRGTDVGREFENTTHRTDGA